LGWTGPGAFVQLICVERLRLAVASLRSVRRYLARYEARTPDAL
jgi:hypothetical protein